MTRDDTVKILRVIASVYPTFNTGRDAQMTAAVWALIFQDDDFEAVKNAVIAFAATDTKGFAPAPGMLKDIVRRTTGSDEMTPVEAWSLVSVALKNSLYGYQEEFNKLPKAIQDTVHNAKQLREWAMLDESEVQTVIASNFQRSYKVRADNKREYDKIPASVRERLGDAVARIGRGGE